MGANIYLVEDDENIRELIRYALDQTGFKVVCFERGDEFLRVAKESVPELILLDIMLPGANGYEILKRIRSSERLKAVPVIFITAKGTEMDKVQGFDLGADDYIVKPFGVLELIARVKAVLRRGSGMPAASKIKYKDIEIDTQSREVYKESEKLDLTLKEYELLLCFLENRGRVLTREQLLEKIWGYDYAGETRTVDMHVKTLRQKLGDDPHTPVYITTMRGVGYKLENE
jgi:two-component system alkaline phosphatase synthesis response regulator PhoP